VTSCHHGWAGRIKDDGSGAVELDLILKLYTTDQAASGSRPNSTTVAARSSKFSSLRRLAAIEVGLEIGAEERSSVSRVR
jgi:hypothetical protein